MPRRPPPSRARIRFGPLLEKCSSLVKMRYATTDTSRPGRKTTDGLWLPEREVWTRAAPPAMAKPISSSDPLAHRQDVALGVFEPRGPGAAARIVSRSALDERRGRVGIQSFAFNLNTLAVKRIGILTAGGDTPALNATIHGAVVRANQLRVEVYGFMKGFNSLFNPRVPYVHLNPLFGIFRNSMHQRRNPDGASRTTWTRNSTSLVDHRPAADLIEGLISSAATAHSMACSPWARGFRRCSLPRPSTTI